jgi:hypothetical protein
MFDLDDNNSEKSLIEFSSEESKSEASNPHHDSDWSEVDTALNHRHLEHNLQTSTLILMHKERENRIFAREILSVWGKIGLVISERSRKLGFDRKLLFG